MKKETIKYGRGQVEGFVVTDDISLTPTTEFQAKEVNFLSVFHAQKLDVLESDGLLGLSPIRYRNKIGSSGEEIHLLITELYKDGVIGKAMFSIYLTDRKSGQSKIQFGGYDQQIVDQSINKNTMQGGYEEGSSNPADGIYWMENTSWSHW